MSQRLLGLPWFPPNCPSAQEHCQAQMPSTAHDCFQPQAALQDEWARRNRYYHQSLIDLIRFLVPEEQSVLEIGCGTGDLLAALKPSRGVGIDSSDSMVQIARTKYPELNWQQGDPQNLDIDVLFDYLVSSHLI